MTEVPGDYVIPRGQTVLEARGIVKRYGHVTALDGADLELRADEVLAIVGDNGAGKSQLIKVLCGAVIPDEGQVLLDGEPVSQQVLPTELIVRESVAMRRVDEAR